jgi:hypothetical protein
MVCCSFLIYMSVTKWNFFVHYRYFMRELVQHEAVVKPHLPLFLTSWVDKTSAQCMYTMSQTRIWLVSHLKAGCWYIECGKTIYPVEEEVVKIAYDRANSQVGEVGSTHVEVPEEENEVDILLLPLKERNKILNQRIRDATKAKAKTDREATRATAKALRDSTAAAEKEARNAEKLGKLKVITTPPLLTKTSYASPSQNPHKRDASFAQLSVSRLQQLASPSLMDATGGALHVQEFFFSGSLLSTDAYYVEQKAFSKEWVDMMAFLEMVCKFSCLFNASCWKCSSFAMNLILNVVCNVQHKSDKPRAFKDMQGTAGGVDLMIVDIPEDLPVPMVSSPPTSVPEWNSEDENLLAMVFDFGSSLVHDNGVLLLFHKNNCRNTG